MIIDKEEHRNMLLEIIKMSTFPGEFIDNLYELKKSVENASTNKDKIDTNTII